MRIPIKLFSLHTMHYSLSYKTKQFLALVIKLFIVIACGYFIYTKLNDNPHFSFSSFLSKLTQNELFSFKNGIILLVFTFLNWFLEILKWQNLVSFYKKTSYKKAAIQSLASLTTSLITPNRIGEYGAKALYFEKSFRKKILGLNFIGNLYQLMATFVFGIAGILYVVKTKGVVVNYIQYLIILSSIILFLLILYFGLNSFAFGKQSIKKSKRFITEIPFSLHLKISFFSLLRYLIFAHQFYFLLLTFTIDISYADAITGVFSMYLIASIIPMLSLFDVVIKGSVAIWIFSLYNSEATSILAITVIMWLFNFVLPASIGSYFVLTFNTSKLITAKE